jgi:4-hydroxy-4-methyl-2-oxoglutarate aldolase
MSTDSDRINPTILNRLEQCSPSAVADTKHESVDTLTAMIKPIHSDCTFAGTVRTVVLDPSALWAPVQTLDTALEDEVIVVDTNDNSEEAVWGELLSTYARSTGVRGVVTNGAVRDVAGVRDLGFPVFARTVTPRGPSGRKEVERNVPVTIGGVSINPGDVLVGDESGVVAIDRDAVEDVTSAAEIIAQTEREVGQLIDEGRALEEAFEDAGM